MNCLHLLYIIPVPPRGAHEAVQNRGSVSADKGNFLFFKRPQRLSDAQGTSYTRRTGGRGGGLFTW